MRISLLLFISFLSVSSVSSVSPETYIGKWRIKGGSIIEIYENAGVFYGKINKRAEDPISNLNGLDNKNPDKELRSRQLLGIDILNNLSYDESGCLSGGTIYNADSGKSYTVKVWIDTDNLDLCYIRAYKGIFFKTFEASRVRE
ncbi:DUF2147 domain-containing protein [Aquimarina sp. 2201CG5-10]|uniref:DUF2147 domain-containing protein n=1 Tax=Aquimarina callyspongiae TaxID=3098150 RepID=UPI002AB455BE|nr:DUF2147 domain-containing protein [Aquimarina sp. 2201CG5-10]MDY8135866.1 DUF2147 domain-containing protein [Aquimarina sp. 2201CG5-10]